MDLRFWYRLTRWLGPTPEPPKLPEVAPALPSDTLHRRALRRAWWLAGLASAARGKADLSASEALRTDPTGASEPHLWQFAYMQRTGEAVALRAALAAALEVIEQQAA